MILKKSSADTFRFTFINTVKKNCIIPILVFCFNLFYQLFDPIARYYNEKYSGSLGLGLEKVVYSFTNPNNDMLGVLFNAGMLLCPLVVAAMIFRFMMNKSAVNVYYSLGVKRTSMFFSKFLAGATIVVASQVIPLVAALIANLTLFGSNAELWRTFIYMLLNYIVLEVYVFSLTAATFSLVGTLVEGLAFSAVYAVSPVIICAYIEFLFKNFLVGYIGNNAHWTSSTANYQILGVGILKANRVDLVNFAADFLCFPYSSAMIARYRLAEGPYDWTSLDYRPLVFWALLTAVIVLFGWLAYKKRKVEIAGFMGSNPKATFAGVFIVATFLSSVLLPELISTDTVAEKLLLMVITAIVFAIVYIVVDAISLRSIKKIGKTLWKYPLHLVIYSLGIIIFVTGFFGFKTRIPAVDKIESVSIRTNTADLMIGPDNTGYLEYYYGTSDYYLPLAFHANEDDNYRLVGGFDSEDDIQRAIDIHKMLIECADTVVDSETVAAPYGERARPVSITLVYHLENGKTLQRMYTVANDEILCKLAEFTETDNYKELVLKAYKEKSAHIVEGEEDYEEFYLDLNHYLTVFSDTYQVGFASPNLTKITKPSDIQYNYNLKNDILQAIGRDIEAGNFAMNYKNDSKLLGYVVLKNFKNISEEYDVYDSNIYDESAEINGGVYVEPIAVEDTEIVYVDAKLEEESEFRVISTDGFSIPVYENMTFTVDFIIANGLEEYFVNEKTPYAVKLWDGVATLGDDQNLYCFSDKTMLFNGTYFYPSAEENYDEEINMPDNAQVITKNPELIAEYESKARMLWLTCYDGVYAQFLFEDGSSTFAYIPK